MTRLVWPDRSWNTALSHRQLLLFPGFELLHLSPDLIVAFSFF